jgi:hypothetical protein
MISNQEFIHNLNNDLFILRTLLKRLNIQNDNTAKMTEILHAITEKCSKFLNPELSSDSSVDLIQTIDEVIGRFPDLIFEKNYSENLKFKTNKVEFIDAICNIIKNSFEAGASIVRIEIKYNMIIFCDDGECTSDIVDKLNANVNFTTKSSGCGIGSRSLRMFCERNNCRLFYSIVPNTNSKIKKGYLKVRIKLPI